MNNDEDIEELKRLLAEDKQQTAEKRNTDMNDT